MICQDWIKDFGNLPLIWLELVSQLLDLESISENSWCLDLDLVLVLNSWKLDSDLDLVLNSWWKDLNLALTRLMMDKDLRWGLKLFVAASPPPFLFSPIWKRGILQITLYLIFYFSLINSSQVVASWRTVVKADGIKLKQILATRLPKTLPARVQNDFN